MTLNRVVLPAPLGPISPVMAPSRISRLAPLTARTPPKCLYTSTARIIADPPVGGATRAFNRAAPSCRQCTFTVTNLPPLISYSL